MTQLILAGVSLPEAIKDTYKAYKEDIGAELEMISGRMTKEIRGSVWRISYSGGYFAPEEKNALLEICERGRREPIQCGFLPQEQDGEALTYSDFWVTSYTRPRFAWSTSELADTEDGSTPISSPLWVGFAVELREVRPSD